MYTIEIHYTTVNSFGSDDYTDTIGLVWKDKELARKALASIKEHYKLYEEYNAWDVRRSEKEIDKEAKSKEWYKNSSSNPGDWHYYCAAEMDDGSWREMGVSMWCGYSETLHSARVICCADEDEDYVKFD